MKWLDKTIRNERRSLERARERFVRKPTEERLHDVRTAARRFRSLLEDVSGLAPCARLLQRVKRATAATDAARDATILLRLLQANIDASELGVAQPLLDALQAQELNATRLARKYLKRARFMR